MSSTNCIYAKLLERLQPSFPRAQRHGSAKRARVVMQAHAFYFEVAPVEPETCVRIKVKFTNPKRHRLVIDSDLSVAQPSHHAIKVWMIQVPRLRIPKREVLRESHRRTSVDILRLAFGGLYHSPVGIEYLNLDGQYPCSLRLVDDFVLHTNRHPRGRNKCSPVLYVNWISGNQANVSIDSCARVPTRCRLT